MACIGSGVSISEGVLFIIGSSSSIVNSCSNAFSKMFCLKMFNFLLW